MALDIPFRRSVIDHYPASLDLRFALNGILPPAGNTVTYTGADNGTFFDSAGVLQTSGSDAARFDHGLASPFLPLGLWIEGQRVWRALHNRDLTNVVWAETNVTTAKNATGLDNVANSASTMTATAANGTALQTVTLTSTERTVSAYVKRITGSGDIQITDNNGTNWTTLSGLSSSLWTRHDITRTQSNPVLGFRIVTDTDVIEVDFVGLEDGAFATSAVDVGASAVTRTADVATISDVSWLNQIEGTFLFKGDAVETNPPNSAHMYSADDGGTTDQIRGYIATGSDQAAFQVKNSGGNNGFTQVAIAIADNTAFKSVGAYSQDSLNHAIDGTLGTEDTSVDLPTTDTLTIFRIGADSGGNELNGHIARITYWPIRLPNGILQALTI